MTDAVEEAVAAAFRDEWGQVFATVIGLIGDWELAEDCVADAFAAALDAWRRDGVPRRPGAWLTVAARNRARDRLRRAARRAAEAGGGRHHARSGTPAAHASSPTTALN